MAIVASAPSLNDFQLRIVDTFRYDYGHPQLDEKIIQYAPNETPSSRFLIKMEIARLAKKCFRVIDLRDIQSDYCVFRFVRPPVPVSSGQAFRCDPASMI